MFTSRKGVQNHFRKEAQKRDQLQSKILQINAHNNYYLETSNNKMLNKILNHCLKKIALKMDYRIPYPHPIIILIIYNKTMIMKID
ncbi:unnamed protein product [Paramecium octaurelia]|uniref:Uncharacterized protein n=1 Tax=Paramecium octaurelia TaxID=43137 RepID=A0A8S1TYT8_PAROT|nr:unnamed protein product [Paramecium octaurelia]